MMCFRPIDFTCPAVSEFRQPLTARIIRVTLAKNLRCQIQEPLAGHSDVQKPSEKAGNGVVIPMVTEFRPPVACIRAVRDGSDELEIVCKIAPPPAPEKFAQPESVREKAPPQNFHLEGGGRDAKPLTTGFAKGFRFHFGGGRPRISELHHWHHRLSGVLPPVLP